MIKGDDQHCANCKSPAQCCCFATISIRHRAGSKKRQNECHDAQDRRQSSAPVRQAEGISCCLLNLVQEATNIEQVLHRH